MDAKSLAAASAVAALVAGGGMAETVEPHGHYLIECFDADGNLKWTDQIENLVVTVGRNFALDTLLSGSAYTASWFLGLVDGASAPTYNAADTMASHAGWTENTGYSNATRPVPNLSGAASAGSKASTATAFNINATGTIAGCFLTTIGTKGGTTGTLYSVGSFTGGNRAVVNGDTLNVTYTASLT
jgi:hypothetical protein